MASLSASRQQTQIETARQAGEISQKLVDMQARSKSTIVVGLVSKLPGRTKPYAWQNDIVHLLGSTTRLTEGLVGGDSLWL